MPESADSDAEIDPTAPLRRASEIIYTSVGGEDVVMLDLVGGRYFSVNAVGARIWDLIEQPTSIDGLCHELCEEYAINPDVCRGEVQSFVQDMIKAGIISVVAG